ncbi:unnamed protein product, partial [Sphagnum balticum]
SGQGGSGGSAPGEGQAQIDRVTYLGEIEQIRGGAERAATGQLDSQLRVVPSATEFRVAAVETKHSGGCSGLPGRAASGAVAIPAAESNFHRGVRTQTSRYLGAAAKVVGTGSRAGREGSCARGKSVRANRIGI